MDRTATSNQEELAGEFHLFRLIREQKEYLAQTSLLADMCAAPRTRIHTRSADACHRFGSLGIHCYATWVAISPIRLFALFRVYVSEDTLQLHTTAAA